MPFALVSAKNDLDKNKLRAHELKKQKQQDFSFVTPPTNHPIRRVWDGIVYWGIQYRYFILAAVLLITTVGIVTIYVRAWTSTNGSGGKSDAADATTIMVITPTPTATATPTPTPSPTPSPTPDPTLRPGDENERIRDLQNRLIELNYMDLDEATLYYGSVTTHAVELFQRQHDLTMDGVAGPKTLDLLFSTEAKKYTLLEGTTGSDVDSLQRQLMDLGYLNVATGYYGSQTVEAVKAFQERNSLGVDGKTGEQTLALLYSPNALASASKIQAEMRRANIINFVDYAIAQLGDPYVFGNVGPNSFDCSGLVYYCLKQAGSSRGRYNAAGYADVTDWEKISSMNSLEIGDLLFFSTGGQAVGHVGIYVGSGEMVDASSSNGKVVRRSCTTDFWVRNFVFARRPW